MLIQNFRRSDSKENVDSGFPVQNIIVQRRHHGYRHGAFARRPVANGAGELPLAIPPRIQKKAARRLPAR
jgi:hypothetical protein